MDKRFLNFLTYGRKIGASDIILKEEENISYRVKGKVERIQRKISKKEIESLYLNMRPLDQVFEEGTSMSDYSPSINYDGALEHEGRYRVNLFSSNDKKCAAIRIINSNIKSLTELTLPETISQMARKYKGLSLIVGKTGAGKSTTLAAIIKDILLKEQCHIITLEDPIEYLFENNKGIVTQRELGKDFMTFEDGITQSLRQSPDYIVIGEIRDVSALKSAVMAAEAGHGILATMHSLGGEQTITKMLSMFSDSEKDFFRYEISSNLNFVLSQKLFFDKDIAFLNYEILRNTKSVSNTIKEGRLNQINNIITLSEKDNMKNFNLKG